MQPNLTRSLWLLPIVLLSAACGGGSSPTPGPVGTPTLAVAPASLSFSATPGGANPASQVITASNTGQGTLAAPTTSVTYASGADWLTATVSGSSAPFTITVQATVGSLAAATYSATVSVASSGATSSPQSVPVTFVIAAAPARTLSGVITYDKVPPYKDPKVGAGLNYVGTIKQPVRGAQVELLDAAGVVITSGVTDKDGRYSFSWTKPGTQLVKVRTKAITVTPVIKVQDNTNGGALWTADSAQFDTSTGSSFSVNIPSGWIAATKKYDPERRSAGPFAVLDTAYTAALAFLAERPTVIFPELPINWSPNNKEQGGDVTKGQIGTSHWNSNTKQLYILGEEDVDTDEYDSHIIAHEWGHYFEDRLSRSDSTGGYHASGQMKDPRMTWGEGWATALSGIVLAPDSVYADTSKLAQSSVDLTFMENNDADDPNPGWFSENSVLHVFYDLWDDSKGAEPFDQVSIPLGTLYDVMVIDQKSTPAFTTIFSFVAALKARISDESVRRNIDTLLAYKGVADPITDPFGKTETHYGQASGGLPGFVPVYNEIKINDPPKTLTFRGAVGKKASEVIAWNDLGPNRLAYFRGNGATVSLVGSTSSTTSESVGLILYEAGRQLRPSPEATTIPASITGFQTTAGTIYTVLVHCNDTTSPDKEFFGSLVVTSP